MKKNSTKNEAVQPTTEVVNAAATTANASEETKKKATRRRKGSKKQQEEAKPQEQPQAQQQELSTEQQPQEKAKPQRFVDVRILATFLQARTEKAQLIKFKKDEEQVKIWLPLAHISLTPAEENFTIIQMPAWLYYRSGMREAFPDVRWSVKKDETETAVPQEGAAASQQPNTMELFKDLKAKHPDAILLFRNGDFYESYNDDAATIASILGLTIVTDTDNQMEMAGFPYGQLDTYLPMLIRKGHRVAICDALEIPKAA